MTREELDTLWFKAMREAGDDFTRYRFAALVAAAEREACIQDVRSYGGIHIYDAGKIVQAIRARGSK